MMTLEILNLKSEVTIEKCKHTHSWGGVGRFLVPPTSLLPKTAVFIKELGNFYIRNFNSETLEFDICGTKGG